MNRYPHRRSLLPLPPDLGHQPPEMSMPFGEFGVSPVPIDGPASLIRANMTPAAPRLGESEEPALFDQAAGKPAAEDPTDSPGRGDMIRPVRRMPVVKMLAPAWKKLRDTVGSLPAERGGLFVSRLNAFFIEDFIFDEGDGHDSAIYYPHAERLNSILERRYEPLGHFFVGVGHSHPPGMWYPSGHAGYGDVKAARSNLRSNEELSALFIPIVESRATTGTFRIHPFVMYRKGFELCPAQLEIVDGPEDDAN